MYLIGAAATGLFGFLYFGMLDSGYAVRRVHRDRAVADPARHDVRPAGRADRRGVHTAPALQRASLGYQLASIIAGGPAPLIATALFAAYHTGYAIAIYIAACAVISLISTALMPDYTGQDISAEYDAGKKQAA